MWGDPPHFFFGLVTVAVEVLTDLIRRHLGELGYELVDLQRRGPSQRPLLQVRMDRPGSTPGHGVTAEDCARAARSLRGLLAAGDFPGPDFALEVSSPGVDRPVRWVEHWRRYVGHEVRVEAAALRGRHRARILAVPDDDHVTLRLADQRELTLELADIKEATLIAEPPSFGKR